MSGEPNWIICIPWSECRVDGSTKVACEKCEEICGLSPATQENASKHGPYKIVCMSCFMKDMTGREQIMPITPKQVKEMRDATETDNFSTEA